MASEAIDVPGGTRPDEGFTLLELVIALAIISIAIGGLVGVLGTAFKSTAIDVHRTDATAIAAAGLAQMKSATDPSSGPLPAVTRNGETYTVTGTVGRATATNGDTNAYTTLGVTVAWTDQGGAHTLAQSTDRYPVTPPTSAVVVCAPPVLASSPTYNSPSSGDPSLDVSWQEPMGGTPVTRWQVQVSPDGGATWTTAVADEPPLPPGATHQVEVGGLAATDAYAVQVVAVTGCADPVAFAATAGAQGSTPPTSSSTCAPGSVTLGPAVAVRSALGTPPGALTTDVTVVVTSPAPCPTGLWVGAQAADGSIVTTALTQSPTGAYSYVGTLPGVSQSWDLGAHAVEVFSGPPSTGVLPTPALATALLCVEQAGASSC